MHILCAVPLYMFLLPLCLCLCVVSSLPKENAVVYASLHIYSHTTSSSSVTVTSQTVSSSAASLRRVPLYCMSLPLSHLVAVVCLRVPLCGVLCTLSHAPFPPPSLLFLVLLFSFVSIGALHCSSLLSARALSHPLAPHTIVHVCFPGLAC